MKVLKHRNEFGSLLIERGLNGIGVEVGVERGIFSDILLKTSELKTLISVDRWRPKRLHHMHRAVELLAKHGSRSICIRGESRDVSRLLQYEILDLVYIDATHSFEAIRSDLRYWWPKLKPGGLFAGHDYMIMTWNEGQRWQEVCGVITAVDEFVKEHGLDLHLTKKDWKSWYCFKPLKKISLL